MVSAIQRGPAPDDWAAAGSDLASEADPYTSPVGKSCWINSVSAIALLMERLADLERFTPDGTRYLLENLKAPDAVGITAVIQDARRRLGQVEAYVAREVGRDDMAQREGVLPDGRPYKISKGDDRKAWNHPSWQDEVRAQVLSGLPAELVNPETGEPVEVATLLAAVQGVHGSTAPKIIALKRLGLDPDDYSERVPGPWSLRVTPASEAPATPTPKD